MQKKNTLVLLLVGLLALSILVFIVQADDTAPVDDTVQAEDAEITAVGSHYIQAVYYQAYIYDDHDGWIAGAGEWSFDMYRGGWVGEVGEYSRDGAGYVNFADRASTWYFTGSTAFWCWAGESDDGGNTWDWQSNAKVEVTLPGSSLNTWVYGTSGRVQDVNHYYRYYVRNYSPSVGAISGPSSGTVGSTLTFSTSGSDSEGDSLTYQWWISGVYVTTSGPTLTRTFTTAGTYSIYVRSRDALGAYSSWSGPKTVVISVVNHPPTVGSISGPSSGTAPVTLTFTTSGSDPDGDTLTYQWWISGVYVTTSGPTLTRTFTTAGTYSIYVRAFDGSLYSSWSGPKTVVISAGGAATIEIWTNKAAYAKGETLTAYIQGFNTGPATTVRVNVWFGLPGGGTYLYETYYTGTLPGYYTSPVYVWKSVTIPYSAASGTYSVNAEMRNPSTNALIDSDTYYFTIS